MPGRADGQPFNGQYRQELTNARVDGWFNALSGHGTTEHSKSSNSQFQLTILDDTTAQDLWRQDDIAARVVETVPAEAFRQGFKLNMEDKEALLNTIDAEPLSDEAIQRILLKAKGLLPLSLRSTRSPHSDVDQIEKKQEQELLALHRGHDGKMPPDVKQKLEELRDKAKSSKRRKDENGPSV